MSPETERAPKENPENAEQLETLNRRSPAETFGVTCSECGGSLRIREGERSIRCEYCGSALFVTRPRGVRSFMMQPRITDGKAKLTALKHLSGETGGRIKARHASIIDVQLIHVPFWRMRGRLMGWVCGESVRMKTVEMPTPDPQGRGTVRTSVEERSPYSKMIFKGVDWSAPACALRSLGLQGISLRTRFLDWDVFDYAMKEKHLFALPMKSIRQARKDAYSYLTRVATPPHSTVDASRFHLFDSNFSIYYYPVYFIRYRHGGRIYSITIDGGDGNVVRGQAPAERRFNAKWIFFVPAAFAFLACTYLPLALFAAGTVYVYDMFHSGGFLPPHRWPALRLGRWFGGDC